MDAKNTYRLLNELMVNNYFANRLEHGMRELVLAFSRQRKASLSTSVWATVGASIAGVATICSVAPVSVPAKLIASGTLLLGGLIAALSPWKALRSERKTEKELGAEERRSERELRASRRAGIATEIRQSIVRVKLTKEMHELEPDDRWTKDTLEYWRRDVKEHLDRLESSRNDEIWKGNQQYLEQLIAWCRACE